MKKILLFLLLAQAVFAQTPLSGTYRIGTNTNTQQSFTKLTDAINALNTRGINGDVVFLLVKSEYSNATGETFPIKIGNFKNTSNKKFTIKPDTGVSTTITASNINGYTGVEMVLQINGSNNVTIDGSNNNSTSKNLNIVNNCNLDYISRAAVGLTGSYKNVTLKNVVFTQKHINGSYAFSAGVYSGGVKIGEEGTSTPSNLVIENSNFSGVKQGVYVKNNANNALTSVTIHNNDFGLHVNSGKAQNAIHLDNVKKFNITENFISGVDSDFTDSNYRAIYVHGSEGEIIRNIIYDIKRNSTSQGISGVYISSNLADSQKANILIANNFITDIQSKGVNGDINQGAFGIVIEKGNGIKIYHNTINLKQQYQVSGFSSALYVMKGTNLDVRNNIFNNNLTYNDIAKAAIIIKDYNNTTFAHLNYNNYYSNGIIGIKGGDTNWISLQNPSYIQTIQNWRNSTGKDANSTNVKPIFVNENNDLHLVPGAIVNVEHLGGQAGLGINIDIDKDTRYAKRPTMGADEIEETKCESKTTWNGETWSNGEPTEFSKVVLSGNYNKTKGFRACSLEILSDVQLNIKKDQVVTVIHNIINNGKIIVENDGALVQVEDDSKYFGNPTAFNLIRTTTPIHRFDYIYWSSPVNEDANVFLLGKNPNNPAIPGLSKDTPFNKFHEWNPNTGWVDILNGNTAMKVAKGYIVRAPQLSDYGVNPYNRNHYKTYDAKFIGVPNNGKIEAEIEPGKWNLIGNPYPSAINLEEFFELNKDLIDATAYIWTHDSPIQLNSQTSTFNYNNTDYIAANVLGNVEVKKKYDADGNFVVVNVDYIAAGQSFLVKAKENVSVPAKITFNNSLRIQKTGNNNNFYRPANNNEAAENWGTTGKHRIWMGISTQANDFNQTLIGYMPEATNGVDSQYDGITYSGKVLSLYTIAEETNLTIQARALPFTKQDVVKVGYKSTVAGNLTIELNKFDGLFSNTDIFLHDKELNVMHNMKNGPYQFHSVAGTYNNRFEVRYAPIESLSVDNSVMTQNEVVIYKADQNIEVKVNNENIKEVAVYDLQGKVLYNNSNVNTNTHRVTSLQVYNQVILVKVVTENNKIKTQKVIL